MNYFLVFCVQIKKNYLFALFTFNISVFNRCLLIYIFSGIGKVKHAEDQRYFWSEHDDYSAYPKSDIITVARYNKLISNFVKTL